MIKIILYVIVILCIFHSIIYYFNIDVFYIKQKPSNSVIGSGANSLNTLDELYININDSINELFIFVYDRRGCSNVSTLRVEFVPCDESFIWIPNSFTPNSNGTNDQFKAYGVNIKQFEMIIYNRWGEKLFITRNLEQGWDGKYNGKFVQLGIYIYKIIYTDVRNEEKNIVGKVSLIK